VLVCGHGTRDACCALRGTVVYTALRQHFGDDELWISSHQGGHRFAANVLVLPAGVQLGRVEPANAVSVTSRALAGLIELDHYRGRTCYDPPVQAAEQAIRRAFGLDGVGDLRLGAAEGPLVRFRDRYGNEHEATVEESAGPVVPASCGAEPEAQRVLVAQLL
ncbi:MAG: sucrase ferredoxin, partial [Gaiellaceae bacterium]